jgi:hypothetical protein
MAWVLVSDFRVSGFSVSGGEQVGSDGTICIWARVLWWLLVWNSLTSATYCLCYFYYHDMC